MIDFNEVQSLKAPSPIHETDVGISIDDNESHESKAFSPIEVTIVGISKCLIGSHKASSSPLMFFIGDGISNEQKCGMLLTIRSPSTVHGFEMNIHFNEVHSSKTLSLIFEIDDGSEIDDNELHP